MAAGARDREAGYIMSPVRRQVRPNYTLQRPPYSLVYAISAPSPKGSQPPQLVPTVRDQVFKSVNLWGTCHSRTKTTVKRERDQGWSRFLQQCLSKVNVSSSSSDGSNRNKPTTYTQHTQHTQHTVYTTHSYPPQTHGVHSTHNTLHTAHIPQRLFFSCAFHIY